MKTVRELHDKACPCLREAISIWIIFLQMCICRLHGKLGKELVVHQCFWSLTY